ncbi:hypothetical protein M3Y94_00774700 [Aphelenchoides besseyi]|nr:hypothetical protein M3Y94_00774700 [Aphelenchoides besseyi]KAI6232298.1 hypothetical protein M3Y95_00471500 [Aphelenchoides besseyi]
MIETTSRSTISTTVVVLAFLSVLATFGLANYIYFGRKCEHTEGLFTHKAKVLSYTPIYNTANTKLLVPHKSKFCFVVSTNQIDKTVKLSFQFRVLNESVVAKKSKWCEDRTTYLTESVLNSPNKSEMNDYVVLCSRRRMATIRTINQRSLDSHCSKPK